MNLDLEMMNGLRIPKFIMHMYRHEWKGLKWNRTKNIKRRNNEKKKQEREDNEDNKRYAYGSTTRTENGEKEIRKRNRLTVETHSISYLQKHT